MEQTLELTKSKNGGKMARIGNKFHDELKDIKKERIKNGKSEDMSSTSKITNLITRHAFWINIKKDLINAKDEEINKYG